MLNVFQVKVSFDTLYWQRGAVAVKVHTALSCLIQSDKYAFVLAVSQKDKHLHVIRDTHTHTREREGERLQLSKVVMTAFHRRGP